MSILRLNDEEQGPEPGSVFRENNSRAFWAIRSFDAVKCGLTIRAHER